MSNVILASKSEIRAKLLKQAGLVFEIIDSNIDERAEKNKLLAGKASPLEVAEALAEAKAVSVSRLRPGWVIGADQTLDLDGLLFDKAGDLREARTRLTALRGCEHTLHSAASIARDGLVVWRQRQSVRLIMREFSEDFLDRYLSRNGDAVLSSVGCYQLEGQGIQLFERIDGDYHAALGLPLLSLLAFLRVCGALAK